MQAKKPDPKDSEWLKSMQQFKVEFFQPADVEAHFQLLKNQFRHSYLLYLESMKKALKEREN